jgi:hypothetical protein
MRELLPVFEYAENHPPFQPLCGSLTVVLINTNNDRWPPHIDPPNP